MKGRGSNCTPHCWDGTRSAEPALFRSHPGGGARSALPAGLPAVPLALRATPNMPGSSTGVTVPTARPCAVPWPRWSRCTSGCTTMSSTTQQAEPRRAPPAAPRAVSMSAGVGAAIAGCPGMPTATVTLTAPASVSTPVPGVGLRGSGPGSCALQRHLGLSRASHDSHRRTARRQGLTTCGLLRRPGGHPGRCRT